MRNTLQYPVTLEEKQTALKEAIAHRMAEGGIGDIHPLALTEVLHEISIPKASVENEARALIKAWESLPEGDYSIEVIQKWLLDDMSPAINALRAALNSPSEV